MEDIMAGNKDHHLTKNGNTWYFITMIKGRRIKRSLGTAAITEARQLRDMHLRERTIPGEVEPETGESSSQLFGEVAQDWAKIMSAEIKASTLSSGIYTKYEWGAGQNFPLPIIAIVFHFIFGAEGGT
jgi:hypothetical protein